MLQERESSVSKQVSHSKILVQPKGNSSYSIFIIIIVDFLKLRELFFFPGMLDIGCLGGVQEGRASRHHMSTFVAAEAESLLGALLSFFWGELLEEFDRVNVHVMIHPYSFLFLDLSFLFS